MVKIGNTGYGSVVVEKMCEENYGGAPHDGFEEWKQGVGMNRTLDRPEQNQI